MNRLIIIGNGFDLSHGLKTSYCDFLDYYFKKAVIELNDKRFYSDPLMEMTITSNSIIPYGNDYSIKEIIEFMRVNRAADLVFKSDLLKNSLKKLDTVRWVDLENDYFIDLKNRVGLVHKEKYDLVKQLNDEFTFLKQELENYLVTQQLDLEKFTPDPEISKIFKEHIPLEQFENETGFDSQAKNVMFLNFNYTNTIEAYKGSNTYTSKKLHETTHPDQINYIHGQLNNQFNPIVFGIGDEFDKDYSQFESHRDNCVFTHIKSFSYLKTSSYHKLINFIEQDHFQVFVVGHSCGISDRTMFREIFEKKNCKVIKLFFYQKPDGSDDFTEKTFEISRHFTNKGIMRKKIMNYSFSKKLPQYDRSNLQ